MQARALGCVLSVIAVAACSELPAEPETYVVPVFAQAIDGGAKNMHAHLNGAQEVPTNDSKAQGHALFQLSADGTELHYRLIVSNIENVTQAHIHCCATTTGTAGVAVWLYPSQAPFQITLIPGRTQGVLAEGVITDARVIGGAIGGTGVAGLLAQIRAGMTYVNVHTSQLPPGEIRGQIE